MENVGKRWRFKGNEQLNTCADVTVRGTLTMLSQNINKQDQRQTILLSHGDPGAFPCFRTCPIAEQAVADALHSADFNCYSPFVGIPPARRAVAEYLSRDLPYDLSADDVYITLGCSQAMEVILTVLASPGANILLPRPGFPNYEARCGFSNIEVRHYDLLYQKGWEVDLDAVEALADENNAAIVIINPGNPCGNVFSDEHLKKGALPQILEKTNKDFFLKYITILKHTSDILYDGIKEIPCITCPQKPEGSVFIMVKLDMSLLENIDDDMDFCVKLAKEESVIVLPGLIVGLKNWLRLSFALDQPSLQDGLARLKSFCQRHAKQFQEINIIGI